MFIDFLNVPGVKVVVTVAVAVVGFTKWTLDLKKIKELNLKNARLEEEVASSKTNIKKDNFSDDNSQSGDGALPSDTAKIVSYHALVTIPNGINEFENERSIVNMLISIMFESSAGSTATYRDWVVGDSVNRLDSVPTPPVVLNSDQYKRNPGFVKIRIEPEKQEDNVNMIQYRVEIKTDISKSSGRLAVHFPYFTRYASMSFDFSALGTIGIPPFKSETVIEDAESGRQVDHHPSKLKIWGDNQVAVVYAKDMPEKSVLGIVW